MNTSVLSSPVIRLLAPSSVPVELAVARRGVQRLHAAGCRVQRTDVLDRQMQRFAGTDAARADDFNQLALLDDLPDVALAVRGGYGATRILAAINYPALAERLSGEGLPLVGYSDFTAIQMALYSQAGLTSLGGPMLTDFGAAQPSGMSWTHFWSALSSPALALSWQPSVHTPQVPTVAGILWGGNLAMLCSLLGSTYFPLIDDGLLFLEDVGEAPFRLERLLYQLLWSGVLARQQAVILGDFTDCESGPRDYGYDRQAALAQFRQHCPVPVIDGLPFGHGPDKLTLAFGVPAELTEAAGQACLRFSGQPQMRQPWSPPVPASIPAEVM